MSDIIIVGGINIDIEGSPFAKLLDCDSNPGTVSIAYGGVGRNIAENPLASGRASACSRLSETTSSARAQRSTWRG